MDNGSGGVDGEGWTMGVEGWIDGRSGGRGGERVGVEGGGRGWLLQP